MKPNDKSSSKKNQLILRAPQDSARRTSPGPIARAWQGSRVGFEALQNVRILVWCLRGWLSSLSSFRTSLREPESRNHKENWIAASARQ
jgi:hypothetical protein